MSFEGSLEELESVRADLEAELEAANESVLWLRAELRTLSRVRAPSRAPWLFLASGWGAFALVVLVRWWLR